MTTGPAGSNAEGETGGDAGGTTADGSVVGRPRVLVQRLVSDAPLPAYALPGDAGADIVTAVDVALAPGERAVLPTGLAIALPAGHAAFVHPRSGLAARAGLGLVNAPGTIDSGYRGEIKIIVINHDPNETLHLSRGERVAQLVIQRVENARFVEVDALPHTERGVGGHGSTGGAGALVGPAAITTDVTTIDVTTIDVSTTDVRAEPAVAVSCSHEHLSSHGGHQ